MDTRPEVFLFIDVAAVDPQRVAIPISDLPDSP